MKRMFIINPAAGKGIGAKSLSAYRARFEKLEGSSQFVLTQSRKDALFQTQRALVSGYTHIIAVGGDGTLNAVLNGFFENGTLINPEAVLGVSRVGTGCDYYGAVAKNKDWRELVENFTPRKVDIGCIDYLSGGRAPLYFINMASIGMSASVVQEHKSLSQQIPPLLSYSLSALKTLISHKPFSATLLLDEKKIEGKFLNVFVAKGKTAGGGMRLGGKVDFDEGKFDVTLVHGMPLAKSLLRFPKLFSGKFENDVHFTKTKAVTIEIHSPAKLPVEFDGEIEGTTDIRISLLPKSVSVAFPS